MAANQPPLIADHADIAPSHRFGSVTFRGENWDLSHLDPFAFRSEIKPALIVDVVVLFSCHCFTHGYARDERDVIPPEEVFLEGNVRRVLNRDRWLLSRKHLPDLVQQLHSGPVRVLGGPLGNYATFRGIDLDGHSVTYAVFFDVQKDQQRRKRMILRVQSAYVPDMTKRFNKAGKVNLSVLLRAVYDGRTIKP